jgi:hypothetical protein
MDWKNRKIDAALNKKMGYFLPIDAKAIQKWSSSTCKSVWNRIISSSLLDDTNICPFCLKHEYIYSSDCNTCEYQITHQNCNLNKSTYQNIWEAIEDSLCAEINFNAIISLIGKKEISTYLKKANARLQKELSNKKTSSHSH